MTIPGPNPILTRRYKEKDKKQTGGWLCLLILLQAILYSHSNQTPPTCQEKKNLVLNLIRLVKQNMG